MSRGPARAGLALEQIEVCGRKDLRRWLRAHHAQGQSIWLVTHKKTADGADYVPYDAIVEEALCFGWIDSLPRILDEKRSMRLLSPRKPGGAWSRVNKERVARLIERGLMAKAGLACVERAKADGSWNKLDRVEQLETPSDLTRALAKHRDAAANFKAFPRSVKRAILEWILQAKRPETRQARIDETATRAARNERANQYRQPGKSRTGTIRLK